MHLSSPERTPKLQLAAEEPSTSECWIPPKKISYIQRQKKNPSNLVGEVKLHLESNFISTRDAQKAQTKPCAYQETPTKTEPDLPLSVYCGGTGQQWPVPGAGALDAADLGVA